MKSIELVEIQFQINHQQNATIFPVYYLTFIYSSTYFGRLHAHHQELTTALTASGFTLERGKSSVVGRGRANRPDHDQRHCYHHTPKVKPEVATAIVELLMMGLRTPEIC
jgi:hypothetical protein